MRSDCKMCNILKVVDSDDRVVLIQAMNTSSVPKTDIAMILSRNGHPISEAAVRRHILKHGSKSG